MAANSNIFSRLPQPWPTEKQAVPHSEMEVLECSQHACRRCNTYWRDVEPSTPPRAGRPASTTLKCRCLDSCRKYRWWYGTLLCIIMVVIVVPSVIFRPRTPFGLYKPGSGFVALDRGDSSDMVDVIYQHASGQIRHGTWTDSTQSWDGGMDNVLGPNASPPRKGTPLMAASYTIGSETTWKIIYINTTNFLQESVGSAAAGEFPTEWSPGTLGLGNFTANSSPHTGLSVCQNMLWFSDPQGFNNGSLVLFYGGADGLNHMLTHEIQDTAWKFNHTFEDSSSDSGVECTCRRSQFLDAWMVNKNGQVIQQTYNSDPTSNNSIYPAGNWTSGVVYDQSIHIPTSISAIKFTGNSTTSVPPDWPISSTFIYINMANDTVNGINVDNTVNRTYSPAVSQSFQHVNSPAIVDDSKIASVTLMTNGQNPGAEHDEESLVIIQSKKDPECITVMTGPFNGHGNAFTSSLIEIGK